MPNRRKITADYLDKKRGELVVRLLFFAFQRFRGPLFARLEERGHAGVGMAHSLVLRNLDWRGTPMAELVRRAGTSRQAVAKVVGELHSMGYLRLDANPKDRRAKTVRFERRGRELVADILEIADAIEAAMVTILGARRFRELRRTLQDLCAAPLPAALADSTGAPR